MTPLATAFKHDAKRRRPARLLSSVIQAKARTHANIHGHAVSETAPPLPRVLDPGLRRDDVVMGATVATDFFAALNESLTS
jgi:hypothetical protein